VFLRNKDLLLTSLIFHILKESTKGHIYIITQNEFNCYHGYLNPEHRRTEIGCVYTSCAKQNRLGL